MRNIQGWHRGSSALLNTCFNPPDSRRDLRTPTRSSAVRPYHKSILSSGGIPLSSEIIWYPFLQILGIVANCLQCRNFILDLHACIDLTDLNSFAQTSACMAPGCVHREERDLEVEIWLKEEVSPLLQCYQVLSSGLDRSNFDILIVFSLISSNFREMWHAAMLSRETNFFAPVPTTHFVVILSLILIRNVAWPRIRHHAHYKGIRLINEIILTYNVTDYKHEDRMIVIY